MPIADFIRARPVWALIASGSLLLLLAFVPSCNGKKRPAAQASTSPIPSSNNAAVQVNLRRDSSHFVAVPIKSTTVVNTNKRPVIYSVRVNLPPETNAAPRSDVAPYGRLLQCQLVNSIESLSPGTPIIGLVTKPLWHQGHLLIPAGTEVHGVAQLDRVRERIGSGGQWVVAFQSGRQMTLSGVALDREFDANGSGWGITDGSAGIRGEILRGSTLSEVKLFLATALSATARGFQETRSTALGSIVASTAQNAGLAASSQTIDAYAQRILETIQRDGVYVRVLAGKQFYLYVTEPIDVLKAVVNATATVQNSTPPAQPAHEP